MKRAIVQLAVAGLVLSALGFQFTKSSQSSSNTAVAPHILQAVDDNQRVVLKGNTHPLARPQFDRGAAPSDLPLNRMLLVLKRSPEQDAALRQLLDEQQDKSSPNYHKWLTPDEFGKQFGPADQDIQITTNWLRQHGFQIGKIGRGRTVLEFSGTAAQVQEAFGTSIHKYVVKGKEHWANANDPQIPAALTPVVAGISTIHDFRKKPMLKLSLQPMLAKYEKGKPLVTFGNPAVHALAPADYRTIYNINPLFNAGNHGQGFTIAVVGRSNLYFSGQDVQNFSSIFSSFYQFSPDIVLNGPDPGDLGGGEEAEATLDATWANAIAPYAKVDLVVSASTNTTDGVDLSELYVVDNNLADVMTESFGTCEQQPGMDSTEAQLIAALAEQAAAQGITYVVASGDSGAEGCYDPSSPIASPPVSVNVLASTPFAIAVGGSEFNESGQDSKYWSSSNDPVTFGSALSYIPENVWNESCSTAQCGNDAGLWAGGGGASIYFSKPSWQTGVVGIPNDGLRDVPDVSLTAAGHDPYLLCLQASCVPDSQGNFSIWLVSGTSASAPSFAGIMALVDQTAHSRQGQANYVLYQLAHNQTMTSCNGSAGIPASTCVFNDITKGNNSVPGEPGYPAGLYPSGVGYDLASGLGSVNVTNLVNKWNSVTLNSTTTTLTLSPSVTTHGSAVSVGVTVTSGTGTPAGDVSLLADISASTSYAIDMCQSLQACTLNSSGTLSATTRLLPGGIYNVHAHYSGDGTHAPSDSALQPVNITWEGSTSTLVAASGFDSFHNPVSFTSGPYGSFVYLRADVSGASGYGIPTGNVIMLDSNGPGYMYSLNSVGTAASPNGIFTESVGSHSFVAKYVGDSSFNPSTSAAAAFTITPAMTRVTASYAPAFQGANFTATINTSSGGFPPGGNVTFTVDGNAVNTSLPSSNTPAVTNALQYILLGAPPLQVGAQAHASFSDTSLGNGQHTLIVTYSSTTMDPNYASSSTLPISFNLQPDFTISAPNPSKITISSPGGAGTLSFSVGALDGFSGSVSFSCSGLPAESACNFSPATVKGSGTTLMTLTTTPPKSSGLNPAVRIQFWASAGVGISGIFLLGIPARQRRWRKLLGTVLLFLAVAGCGGGTSSPSPSVQHDPGTTTGTYSANVVASSGAVVHKVPFELVIQ